MAQKQGSGHKATRERIAEMFRKTWAVLTLPFYAIVRLVQRVALGQKATEEADKNANKAEFQHQRRMALEKESKLIQQNMMDRLEHSERNKELGELGIENIVVHRIDIGVKNADLGVELHLKDGTKFELYYDKDKNPLEDLRMCPKEVVALARQLFNESAYDPRGLDSLATKNGEHTEDTVVSEDNIEVSVVDHDESTKDEYDCAEGTEIEDPVINVSVSEETVPDGISVSPASVDDKNVLHIVCTVKENDTMIEIEANRALDGSAFTVIASPSDLKPEQWSEALEKISKAFDAVKPNEMCAGDRIKEVSDLIRQNPDPSVPQFYAVGKAMFAPEHSMEKPAIKVSSTDNPDISSSFTVDAASNIIDLRVAKAYASVIVGASHTLGLNEAVCVEYPFSSEHDGFTGNFNVRVCGDPSKTVVFGSEMCQDTNFGLAHIISESDLSALKLGKLCEQFYPGNDDSYSYPQGIALTHQCNSVDAVVQHVLANLPFCSSSDQIITNGMVFSTAEEGANTVITVQGMERGDKAYSLTLNGFNDPQATKKLEKLMTEKMHYSAKDAPLMQQQCSLMEETR